MGLWEALLLGLVQGATEFLPVSSSGHLVLTEALLGVREGGLLVEVTLHTGTLLAVLVYFRHRLAWLVARSLTRGPEGPQAHRYILWLLIGTLPAAAVGLLLEDSIAAVFESTQAALWGLMVTGVILFTSRWARPRQTRPDGPAGLAMGLAQAVAILPGISRSGSTIAVGLWAGTDRREAAEFSFLLSIPAIGGAAFLHLLDLFEGGAGAVAPLAGGLVMGLVASFLSGLAAIALLLEVLRRRGLAPFAWYCWGVGIIGLLVV